MAAVTPPSPQAPARRLVARRREAPLGPEVPEPSIVSGLVYAGLVAMFLLIAGAMLLPRAGVIGLARTTSPKPWDLAIVIAGIVSTLAVGVIVARRAPAVREHARVAGDHDPYARWELALLLGTFAAAAAVTVLAFAAWRGILDAGDMGAPILAATALLVAFGPYGAFAHFRERRTNALEERFPDFLRDLNESYRAGMTMSHAIRVAARGDYGRLNPEIRRMAQQVSWGTPFTEALRLLAERVPTPTVTRAVALISKATRAGGNVADVLSAAARDARELKALDKERRLNMALYVIVIYVAFGVFLAVTAALQTLLIPALLGGAEGVGGAIQGFGSGTLSVLDFRYIYFGVGVVQAVGSGVVAGAMSSGNAETGFKHAAIQLAVVILVLGFL